MVYFYNYMLSACVVFVSLQIHSAGTSDSGKLPGTPGLQRGRCQGAACRFVGRGAGQRRAARVGQAQEVAAPGTPKRRQLEGQAQSVGAIQGQQQACSGQGACPARRNVPVRQPGVVRRGTGHHKKGHGQWHGKKRSMSGHMRIQRSTVTTPTPSAPPQETVRAEGSQPAAAVPQQVEGKPESLSVVAPSVTTPAVPEGVSAAAQASTPAAVVLQEAPKVPEQRLQPIVSTGSAAAAAQRPGREGGWQRKKMGKKKWHKGKGKHGKGWHKKKQRTVVR